MTAISTTDHDDGDDREAREASLGLAALERHLADVAVPPADPAPAEPAPSSVPAPGRGGLTRRVRRRVAEHAEAHQLLTLEADTAPLRVTSERVRAKHKAVTEAAALWQLDRDPRVLAYRDAKVRRLILAVALLSLTLALAWSTAGVQAFAAEGAPAWSPQWCFAWLAEPFCSLALLMVVAGRAYLTTRGHPLRSGSVDRTEWVFLGLTVGMNAWPHLPGVATVFTVSSLVLHLLGPVVAVAVVRCLPRLLAAFSTLNLHLTDTDPPETTEPAAAVAVTAERVATPAPAPVAVAGLDQQRSTPARRRAAGAKTVRSTIPEPKRRTFEQTRAEFRQAIETRPDGFDPTNAESIRRTLHCGKPVSTRLRDEFMRGEFTNTD